MSKVDVAVVGASGYTGLMLIKLLLNHPKFNLTFVGTREGGEKLSNLHPSLLDISDLEVEKIDPEKIAKKCKLAFLALPHKASMSFAKELLKFDVKVIDLSADYRISLEAYEKYYDKHLDLPNLKEAVYGLPEINREKTKKAKLIANPGCYPTASLLAILPFAKYIKKDTPIFIDAKSGVSGAGKAASLTTHFVSVNENFNSYKALQHRHEPEILEHLRSQNIDNSINFVPHLLPITSGMLVSAYMQVNSQFNATEVLKSFYKDEEFVRVRDDSVSIKDTVGTNYCDIFALQRDDILFVSSSIDNILRGASSQALLNANLLFGFDENLGIPKIANLL